MSLAEKVMCETSSSGGLLLIFVAAVSLICSSCSGNGVAGTSSGSGPGNPSAPSAPSTPGPAVAVTISGPAAVLAGQTATFTSNVQNTSNTAVTWEPSSLITPTGVFTAPTFPTSDGIMWVTAISQADPTKFAEVPVTIQFSNVSLEGSFAFSLNGNSANAPFSAAGTFQMDGNGNISGGAEDVNGSAGVLSNMSLSGTYNVGPDGRGTATITSSRGTDHYRFVITDGPQLQLIGFDPGVSVHGVASFQYSTPLNLSAIAGNWSFFLSGWSSGKPVAQAGRFSLDSAGNITQGIIDSDTAGTVVSGAAFTGSVSNISSTGRGTASFIGALGTSNFVFDVGPPGTIYLVGTDSGIFLSGSAYQQQIATYSSSSLSGSYTFLLTGSDNSGAPAAQAGELNANGSGLITSGLFDVNDNGAALLQQPLSGVYIVSANGRGIATLSSPRGTASYAFYLLSQNRAVVLETDGFDVMQGFATLQTSVAVSGNLGFTSFGGSPSGGSETIGRAAVDVSGHFTGGVEDIVQAGTLIPDLPVSLSYQANAPGRGTAQFATSNGTSNFVFYTLAPSEYVYLGVDPSGVLAGSFMLQSSLGYWDY